MNDEQLSALLEKQHQRAHMNIAPRYPEPVKPIPFTELGENLIRLHMIHAEHKGLLDCPGLAPAPTVWVWVILACAVGVGWLFRGAI